MAGLFSTLFGLRSGGSQNAETSSAKDSEMPDEVEEIGNEDDLIDEDLEVDDGDDADDD